MKKLTSVVVLFGLLLVLMPGATLAEETELSLELWCPGTWEATASPSRCSLYSGSHSVDGSTTLIIDSDQMLMIYPNATLFNEGTIFIKDHESGSTTGLLVNNGQLYNNGTINNEPGSSDTIAGTINNGGGTLYNNGTIDCTNNNMTSNFQNIYGTVNNNVDGTININGRCLASDEFSEINNDGTINISVGGLVVNQGIFNNNGTIDNTGQLHNTSENGPGEFHNRGFVFNQHGYIYNKGTIFNYRCKGEVGVITAGPTNLDNYGAIVYVNGQECSAE